MVGSLNSDSPLISILVTVFSRANSIVITESGKQVRNYTKTAQTEEKEELTLFSTIRINTFFLFNR